VIVVVWKQSSHVLPESTKREGGRKGWRMEVDSEIKEVAIVTLCEIDLFVSREIAKSK
jgi:hypothetical protein